MKNREKNQPMRTQTDGACSRKRQMEGASGCPRILIAGTGSGCGKTTVTCALLGALKARGLVVASFKCGPDYIDPMFHSEILGTPSRNLDLFLMGEKGVRYSLAENGKNADISVVEGVMGFYDGAGLLPIRAVTLQILFRHR